MTNRTARSKMLLLSIWLESSRARPAWRFVLEEPATGARSGFVDQADLLEALQAHFDVMQGSSRLEPVERAKSAPNTNGDLS